jgi:predicted DNA-binding transcriptional regulator AlpA
MLASLPKELSMSVRLPSESRLKAAVSVTEMARLCSLSRGRFYELVRAGVMPQPCYALGTRRALYPRELQEVCLHVRSSQIGIDGQYVIFYAPRSVETCHQNHRRDRRVTGSRSSTGIHVDLRDGLRDLGMESVTEAQVEVAVQACYPNGHAGADEGEVLRTVWRHLRRTNGG